MLIYMPLYTQSLQQWRIAYLVMKWLENNGLVLHVNNDHPSTILDTPNFVLDNTDNTNHISVFGTTVSFHLAAQHFLDALLVARAQLRWLHIDNLPLLHDKVHLCRLM